MKHAATALVVPVTNAVTITITMADLLMGIAGATPTGPQSTFNYLIDALLADPNLRSMYLRRLRSLMDEYTNGKLAGVYCLFIAVCPFPWQVGALEEAACMSVCSCCACLQQGLCQPCCRLVCLCSILQ